MPFPTVDCIINYLLLLRPFCYVPTTNMPSPIVDSKSVLPEKQGSFPIFAEKCENL